MQKSFGTLKGIPVYKVDKFSDEFYKQGFIQVIDDGDRYWKICTTSRVADGVYDSFAGNTTIYDEEDFNKSIEQLLKHRVPTPIYKEEKNLTEECVECLLPKLDDIIDEIMGSVGTTCEDLLKIASQSPVVG